MRSLAYSILDVFAERALEGNPLAVFHDGRGLTTEQMQALARETNLSETTFVLPSEHPERDRAEGVRVRIFTTQEELPFAGHPTLGTASWLRLNLPVLRDAEVVTLQLKVGPIPVRFEAAGNAAAQGLYGAMRQRDPEFGEEYDRSEVARVLGLHEPDLLPGYRPQTVSTGNPFCLVALRSMEVLTQLAIPQGLATAWLRERGARWFYCIAPGPDSEPDSEGLSTGGWRARMQWQGGEDPATGSAAGPCIAWLVRRGLALSDAEITIWQGVEMKRPSRLTVRASLREDTVCEVWVAGRTIPVATGRFLLPE